MIENFYTTSFTVSRLSYAGGKGTYASVGTFYGHMQQAQTLTAEQLPNRFAEVHSVWCDESTDVKAGDRINDGTNDYKVQGVQLNNVGLNRHKELLVNKEHAE